MNNNNPRTFNNLQTTNALGLDITRIGTLKQEKVGVPVSTAFSTGRASAPLISPAGFQVPQNEQLTGNPCLYSAIINWKKASRQIARGPRSSLTGRRNSALIKLKTP